MTNIKVAHSVYPYLFLTGSWIYSQITTLKDIESIIITDNKVNLDIYPFDKVFSLSEAENFIKKYSILNYKLTRRYTPFVCKILSENNVDIIHSHFGNFGWHDIKAKKKLNIPQITTFYGYDLSRLPKMLRWKIGYKSLFKNCDRFMVEGSYMKKSLVNLGCPSNKVVVKHIGIDIDKIPFSPRAIGSDGIIKILASGTFRPKKGISYATEAFARLCKKYDNIRLTIVGDGKIDTELIEKEKILQIIKKYNIENRVDLLGYQPYETLIHLGYSHHIFISPSIHAENGDNEGGSPVTITEMSASGMPILSTNHCDIPEVVLDDISGYLVAEKDLGSLTERLEYLIQNENIWNKLGIAGRQHIEKNYNLKKQSLKQSELYRCLLSGKDFVGD